MRLRSRGQLARIDARGPRSVAHALNRRERSEGSGSLRAREAGRDDRIIHGDFDS
jgi:hypothetical protein